MNKDEKNKDLENIVNGALAEWVLRKMYNTDQSVLVAKRVIEAGYRKVGEDEIVIEKREYEALLLEQKRLKEIVDRIPCGYKLIGNEEVVISKHLYEQLKKHNADRKRLRLRWHQAKQELEQAKQETAREILQEILYTKSCEEWFENEQLVDFGKKIVDKIENLANKYGIELEG